MRPPIRYTSVARLGVYFGGPVSSFCGPFVVKRQYIEWPCWCAGYMGRITFHLVLVLWKSWRCDCAHPIRYTPVARFWVPFVYPFRPFVDRLLWNGSISNGLVGLLVTWVGPRSIFYLFFGFVGAVFAPTSFDILPLLVLGSLLVDSFSSFCGL